MGFQKTYFYFIDHNYLFIWGEKKSNIPLQCTVVLFIKELFFLIALRNRIFQANANLTKYSTYEILKFLSKTILRSKITFLHEYLRFEHICQIEIVQNLQVSKRKLNNSQISPISKNMIWFFTFQNFFFFFFFVWHEIKSVLTQCYVTWSWPKMVDYRWVTETNNSLFLIDRRHE